MSDITIDCDTVDVRTDGSVKNLRVFLDNIDDNDVLDWPALADLIERRKDELYDILDPEAVAKHHGRQLVEE